MSCWLTSIFIVFAIPISFAQYGIKHNADGSIISNSGSVTIFQRYFKHSVRNKRASYFIDPAPRLIYSMPVPSDWAAYIVSEHNRYRRLVSSILYLIGFRF